MSVNTLSTRDLRKFPDGKTRPLAFINGFVTIRGVKIYTQEEAMKAWGITRPTYYKWVTEKRIKRVKITIGQEGFEIIRWGVAEQEIARIKSIIKEGWVRGKSKMPKNKK